MAVKKGQKGKSKPKKPAQSSASDIPLPMATGAAAAAADSIIRRGGHTVTVRQHASKGRVLLATKNFKPGQLIFSEAAIVHANWHEHWCLQCDAEHSADTCTVVRCARIT